MWKQQGIDLSQRELRTHEGGQEAGPNRCSQCIEVVLTWVSRTAVRRVAQIHTPKPHTAMSQDRAGGRGAAAVALFP